MPLENSNNTPGVGARNYPHRKSPVRCTVARSGPLSPLGEYYGCRTEPSTPTQNQGTNGHPSVPYQLATKRGRTFDLTA